MTAADKLRELLATRPAMPNLVELTRWWQTSGDLVPEAFGDLEAERDTYRSMLCDVLASASPNERDHPCMSKAWARARVLLKDGPELSRQPNSERCPTGFCCVHEVRCPGTVR